MALPTTQGLTTQLQNESVRNQPTSPMDGNVTRPMRSADLVKAMRDGKLSQLGEEYGSRAGIRETKSTPMTNALMAESEKVPATPLQTTTSANQTKTSVADEIIQPIDVPTPMTDAKENVTLSPTGTVNTGLMSDTPQQIA